MDHKYYKILIEKKTDKLIDDDELLILNKHLETCEECRNDLKEVEEMEKLIKMHRYRSPEDKIWTKYKGGFYAKIERGIGWIFFSIGIIVLLISGMFYFIRDFLFDPSVSLVLRLGVSALIIGFVILLVSIIRERVFFNKRERYKEVKR